ncbi:hypothetical protein M422DRAFT_37903, partial [Sphaerobolus stellatus SS14]
KPPTTDIQWNKQQESRRKLSQLVEGWYRKLGDFLPGDAVDALSTGDMGPEDQTKTRTLGWNGTEGRTYVCKVGYRV